MLTPDLVRLDLEDLLHYQLVARKLDVLRTSVLKTGNLRSTRNLFRPILRSLILETQLLPFPPTLPQRRINPFVLVPSTLPLPNLLTLDPSSTNNATPISPPAHSSVLVKWYGLQSLKVHSPPRKIHKTGRLKSLIGRLSFNPVQNVPFPDSVNLTFQVKILLRNSSTTRGGSIESFIWEV